MEMILNKCYGGLSFSKEAMECAGFQWEDRYDEGLRYSPAIIEVVKNLGDIANGRYAKLEVVTIPDEATDTMMLEYDGVETMLYVLGGKIHQV